MGLISYITKKFSILIFKLKRFKYYRTQTRSHSRNRPLKIWKTRLVTLLSRKKDKYLNRNNRRRFVAPLETGRKGIGRTAERKYLTLPRLSNLWSNEVQGEGLLKGSPSFAASRVVIKNGIELTHCMSVVVRSVRVPAFMAASHAAIEFIIIIRPEYRERARDDSTLSRWFFFAMRNL